MQDRPRLVGKYAATLATAWMGLDQHMHQHGAEVGEVKAVTLIGKGQVPDECEAGPARRQHWTAYLVVIGSFQLADHVMTLAVETAVPAWVGIAKPLGLVMMAVAVVGAGASWLRRK